MTPEIGQAIEELREVFPDATISVLDDPQGGAFVTVEPVDPGAQYVQRDTWVKFHITFQYPYSDVYPHFVRPDLSRIDGKPLGEAMTLGSFVGDSQQAIQISRKSNNHDPSTNTAALKLVKVLQWLRSR